MEYKPDLEHRFAESEHWKKVILPDFGKTEEFWAGENEEKGIMRCPICEAYGNEHHFEHGLCSKCFKTNLMVWVETTAEGKESAEQDNTYEIWYKE
jgi:uncharacterized OB-fold protein